LRNAAPTLAMARRKQPAMKRFLDYLVDRPGDWTSSHVIGQALGLDWNKAAGVLGAFGRRWHNRYRQPKRGGSSTRGGTTASTTRSAACRSVRRR
jgi:hypothetical protein